MGINGTKDIEIQLKWNPGRHGGTLAGNFDTKETNSRFPHIIGMETFSETLHSHFPSNLGTTFPIILFSSGPEVRSQSEPTSTTAGANRIFLITQGSILGQT